MALRWMHVVAHAEDDRKWRPMAETGFDHERIAVQVWRSSSRSGDTKTPESKRTLSLPQIVADALESPRKRVPRRADEMDRRPEPVASSSPARTAAITPKTR